ncbi:helix-turn-helix transcriptional regulator [Mucilaginibacter corticis]|uniref:Helix-turn-helix transcriptional regulator n=1 Tax=Mucilaginibacter corticis TaxID=2597670 RepID=A0A556MKE9_9SPHI|nr:helix-turn-helix domain-containing protein [Mucilaginibacter corticis]TSJ40343.1 helix-turn-helix transcriptional regulator [Mucilaginibacter corticis]
MTKKRQVDYSCSMEAALSVISGKWKLKILNQLRNGPKRYSEINRGISGMTEKMLSQQLRELEEDQIITRKIYPEVPPRVEYTFTALGLEMSVIFKSLEVWGNHFTNNNKPDGEAKAIDESCFILNKEVLTEAK